MYYRKFLISSLVVFLLSACSSPSQGNAEFNNLVDAAISETMTAANGGTEAAVPDRTATPAATTPVTVCLGNTPNTSFLPEITSEAILEVLRPAGVVQTDYDWRAGSLTKVPSISARDVLVQTDIAVQVGDRVLNSDGLHVTLQGGTYIRPTGCRSGDCAVPFDVSAGMQMEQLQVTFELRSDFFWQDGVPVTAGDSVYAFSLDQDGQSGEVSDRAARTAQYTSNSETMVTWIGIPGYLPQDYADHYWRPAPSHLQEDAHALSYGAYQMLEWEAERIVLTIRPEYIEEPYYSTIIFNLIDETQWNIDLLHSGTCDVLDETISRAIWAGTAPSGISQYLMGGSAWEGLHFGITPRSYDDIYSQPGGDRADFFGDVRTRAAIAFCVDRTAVAALAGMSEDAVLETYTPVEHPAFNPKISGYAYDPTAAGDLLDEVGWLMGEDGVRTAQGVNGILDDTRFSINYFTVDNPRNTAIAQRIIADLAACGIEISLSASDSDTLFAVGETGLLFGRNFDLTQFSWSFSSNMSPSCHLYLSAAVPGAELSTFPYGWGGWNLTGWRNDAYDVSCNQARGALSGETNYLPAHYQAQIFFYEDLPSLPLFVNQVFFLASDGICGLNTGVFPLTYDIEGWSPCEK